MPPIRLLQNATGWAGMAGKGSTRRKYRKASVVVTAAISHSEWKLLEIAVVRESIVRLDCWKSIVS